MWGMMDSELKYIKGGVQISGTIINAAVRLFNLALELGRTIGSSIRWKEENRVCPIID